MAIRNTKGLDALRALSEGGSSGLSAYRTAQGNEATSRTTALQGALGGSNVAEAAAQAQAKYSPKVDTSGLGVGQLGTAADSYLSQASNKLASQKYEDQANLALQADALARQSVSEKDRALMLQGAADAMADQQRADVGATADLGGQLGNLAQRKANLRGQLTEFDQANTANGATAHLAALGAAGNPELIAQMQAAQAQREQQRGDILRQMSGLDEQYAAAADQYAGFLGTDSKGLLDRYAAADQGPAGDTEAVRSFLGEEGMQGMAQGALAANENAIKASGESRLRDLAPAFGYNPLVAAGMFREGSAQDKDMAEASALANEEDFIAGRVDPKEEAASTASALGFADPKEYTQVLGRTNMDNDEAISAMQSPVWGGIEEIARDFTLTPGADFDEFKDNIKNFVNAQPAPAGFDPSKWKDEQSKLIQLGIARYQDAAKTSEAN